MRTLKGWLGVVTTAALAAGCLTGAATAQENAPQAPPPPNAEQQGQNRDNMRERLKNMTPEERKAAMEKFYGEALKRQGFTDAEIESLKQFQTARQEAQTKLNESFKNLTTVTRNKEATDDQAKTAVEQYREAMKAHDASVSDARKKLDESVHYSTRPKIEATLLMMGVLDNGMPAGPRAMMNRGGGLGAAGLKGREGRGQKDRGGRGKGDNGGKAFAPAQ